MTLALAPFFLYPFPAAELGLVLVSSGRNRVSRKLTAAQALARDPKAVAVLDGPMWDDGGRLKFRYLDVAAGVDHPGVSPTLGGTISVVNGVASYARGSTTAPGATAAVQGYPELIRDGVNVAPTTGEALERRWRAGAGIMADGAVCMVLGVGTIHDVTERARAAGVVWLVYTDGGTSGSFQVRGQPRHGDASNSAVDSWIVRRAVSGGGGGVLFFLGVLGALAWWATRGAS